MLSCIVCSVLVPVCAGNFFGNPSAHEPPPSLSCSPSNLLRSPGQRSAHGVRPVGEFCGSYLTAAGLVCVCSILQTLRVRYGLDMIYTYSSNILIAVRSTSCFPLHNSHMRPAT